MSIDKKTAVAYMCSSCGEYAFFQLNAFLFSGTRKQELICSCDGSRLEITKNSNKSFKLDITCPVCTQKHSYTVSQSQFWSGEPIIYSCPFYEANLLFIGESDRIEEAVSEYIAEELQLMKADAPVQDTPEMTFLYNACKSIRMLESELERLRICDCEDPHLTVAYNEQDVFLICKACRHCEPIPLDRVEQFLNAITQQDNS